MVLVVAGLFAAVILIHKPQSYKYPSHFREEFAPVHVHQAEMTLACAAAMTNILMGIVDVAKEFPSLSEIGSSSIKVWGSTDAPTYYVIYRKNAQVVYPILTNAVRSTGVDGGNACINNLRPCGWQMVIESGGIDLDFSICDAENSLGLKASGKYYSLLAVNESSKYYLNYYVDLHTPNASLEKRLSDIIETNVDVLRSELHIISGVNPQTIPRAASSK